VVSANPYLPRPCFNGGKDREDGTMKLLLPLIALAGAFSLLMTGSGAAFGYL
jgi:hypothetical protein